MGRKRGSRSEDYDEKRAELARRVFRCLVDDGCSSFHAIAQFAGVTRPTLRHYFGDRDGAVRAALEEASFIGRAIVRQVAEAEGDTVQEALRTALEAVVLGWRDYRVSRLHEVGLKVGLETEDTGRTYLAAILDPLVEGFEQLIERLQRADLLDRARNARVVALTVVSPLLFTLLHQYSLGGNEVQPVAFGPLLDEVIGAATRGGRAQERQG